MKKIISLVSLVTLILLTVCACTVKIDRAPATTDLEGRVVEVVSIDEDEMVVVICGGDYDGNEYAVDPIKDICEGDVLTAIFDNNGTNTPIDDEIISLEAR